MARSCRSLQLRPVTPLRMDATAACANAWLPLLTPVRVGFQLGSRSHARSPARLPLCCSRLATAVAPSTLPLLRLDAVAAHDHAWLPLLLTPVLAKHSRARSPARLSFCCSRLATTAALRCCCLRPRLATVAAYAYACLPLSLFLGSARPRGSCFGVRPLAVWRALKGMTLGTRVYG